MIGSGVIKALLENPNSETEILYNYFQGGGTPVYFVFQSSS